MPQQEHINFVFLKDVPSRLYGQMLVEALANSGIRAIIKSDDIGIVLGSHGTSSPVRVEVWVDRSCLQSAKEIAHQILDGF
ncbi:MAG: hypothetical protein KKG33_10645 [candidate division Zixibacteria bacterium]|nr:hypothetical protein [candidate division Zixibacteria bacterium]MBU1470152.1 hypothetical protein [candidate division Zixibacteria bacterium]MBU2626005.1 hypothetical protein [candidate division Zixibacteria bacterium]